MRINFWSISLLIILFLLGVKDLKANEPLSSLKSDSLEFYINRVKLIGEIPSSELLEIGNILEKLPDDRSDRNWYLNFAKAQGEYFFQNYQKSTTYFEQALDNFEFINDSSQLRTVYNQLGNINYILRFDKKAFEYYQMVYEIAKKYNRKDWIANTYNNLGLVCHHQRDFKQAEFYYSRAAYLYDQLNDEKSIADVNYNRAMTFSLAKNTEMAQNYTQESLQTYKKLNDIEGLGNTTYFLGQISEDNGLIREADAYYLKSFKYFEQIRDSVNQMPCLMKLAGIAIKDNRFEEAKKHILLFNQINAKIKDIEGTKEVLNLEYLLYKQMGNYLLSLQALEKMSVVKDSMVLLADAQHFAELRAKFDNDVKEKELLRLQEVANLNRIIYLSLTILAVTLVVLILLIWRSHHAKEEKRILLLKHKVLRAQMDPHFIFNTMSALQCLILETKTEEASAFLQDFSSLLRMVLQYSRDELVTVEKEKMILEYYMSLQSRRYDNCISFQVVVDEGLLKDAVLIPPMLAQPFVENSLKHGELMTVNQPYILVSIQREEDNLLLKIEDNGIGMIASAKKRQDQDIHKSMAISITNERLKLILGNQKNNNPLLLKDLSEEGRQGTRVEIRIPFLTESLIQL